MKTNTIVIALGATAYASVVRRDATTITGLLTTIHDSMANVDEHLEQYHGGPPIALHQAGSALIQVLKESTETANCIAPLTIEDVISIAGVSQQVTDIGSKFLNELAEAAPLFAENGLCELTLKFTDGLTEASNDFFKATTAKFPPESQAKAAEEIAGSNALFDKVKAAYAPGTCVNKVEHPGGNEGGEGGCSKAPVESASKTSVVWGTPTGPPSLPTGVPGCPHNGSLPGRPAIPIEKGSAYALSASGGFAALAAAAALML